jgi:hypothetical protein
VEDVMKRPDLEGLRVRLAGNDAVYLIDQGQKRHIHDPTSYGNLFRTWDNIHVDLDVEAIDSGLPIDAGAFLFRCYDSPKVFLYDAGRKRWIQSPATMDRYQFNWDRIQVFHIPLKDIAWPDGPVISATGRPD